VTALPSWIRVILYMRALSSAPAPDRPGSAACGAPEYVVTGICTNLVFTRSLAHLERRRALPHWLYC
jgi:hypothetical protein